MADGSEPFVFERSITDELVEMDMPVLAVGGGSGDFTANALEQVARGVTTMTVSGIGHYAAM